MIWFTKKFLVRKINNTKIFLPRSKFSLLEFKKYKYAHIKFFAAYINLKFK